MIQENSDFTTGCYENSHAKTEAEGSVDFYGSGTASRAMIDGNQIGALALDIDEGTVEGLLYDLVFGPALPQLGLVRFLSRIAPQSFKNCICRIQPPSDGRGMYGETLIRPRPDRFAPATFPVASLTEKQLICVLADPTARISYQQLYTSIPCKEDTLRGHLISAGLVYKGAILTGQTFSSTELRLEFVPYLTALKQQGSFVQRILRIAQEADIV